MKNTIKAFINQVKKALTTKSSLPESISNSAFVNANGDIIARDFKNDLAITVFIAGIVDDVSKREMLYNKDALTLAADTGIFAGGVILPEAYADLFTTPAEDFKQVTTVDADIISAAANTVSRDNSRPVLTALHIATNGYIEACDGFRAYRKKITAPNPAALNKYEAANGLLIPGGVASYALKGGVTISNGDKYIKLEDAAGLVLFARKLDGNWINLDAIYNPTSAREKARAAVVTVKDVKTLASVLKTAISAKPAGRYSRGEIVMRVRNNNFEYFIPALDIYGSVKAEADHDTPAGFFYTLNPKYLYDAIINQGGVILALPESKQAPAFCNTPDGSGAALVLPICDDGINPFDRYDREQREKEAATEAAKPAEDTAPESVTEAPEAETTPEAAPETAAAEDTPEAATTEAPAADPGDDTPETDAAPEEIPPEFIKAREIYRRLISSNYTPDKFRAAEAEIIYKEHRDVLQPIARRAGGLYIDTLAIIAAIIAAYDETEKEVTTK